MENGLFLTERGKTMGDIGKEYKDGFTSLAEDYMSLFKSDKNKDGEKAPSPSVWNFVKRLARNNFKYSCRLLSGRNSKAWTIPFIAPVMAIELKYGLVGIPAYIASRSLLKSSIEHRKMFKIQQHLFQQYKDKYIVRDFKQDGDNIVLCLYLDAPLADGDVQNIEHSVNATHSKTLYHPRNKRFATMLFEIGKNNSYRKIPKTNVVARLTAILEEYKPEYIKSVETETEERHDFILTCDIKRLVKQIENIEHKLGAKKGSLSIDNAFGVSTFTVRKPVTKQYQLDDYIRDCKRPGNMVLPFILGINRTNGNPIIVDYDSTQHTMFAGATGTAKSSCVHAILQSLMYWNDNIRYYMLDLKGTEMGRYQQFNNCKVELIGDPRHGNSVRDSYKHITKLVNEVYEEYTRRNNLFMTNGVPDLETWNITHPNEKLPYIIFLIDEINYLYETLEKKAKTVKGEPNAERKLLDILEEVIGNLFARGRSTGIYCIHTMQQVRDGDYNIAWRRNMMTKIALCLGSKEQSRNVLENAPHLVDEAQDQTTGQYTVLDKNKNIYKCQNLRYPKTFTHKTYLELQNLYERGSENADKKDVAEIEIIDKEEKQPSKNASC
jgi:hypothetical protein